MKKRLIVLLILFLININVNALSYGGCEYKEITRMKSIVSNVNISYSYREVYGNAVFDITLTNIRPEIYFYDSVSDKRYYYSDTNDGEITINGYSNTSGNYKFYSNNSNCLDVSLGSKFYNLPVYNVYYNDIWCKDKHNLSFCQKWVNKSFSYNTFRKYVTDYEKSKNNKPEDENQIVEVDKNVVGVLGVLYAKYYYYFLIGIIVVCIIIIIFKNKKDSFKI